MLVAPDISVHVLLLADCCHWIVPTVPLTESVVVLVPVHTVPAPLTVPLLEAGFTVISAPELLAVAQIPFCTTAR